MWGVAMRPIIVRDEDSLVAVLRGRRLEMGLGQRELDDAIGGSDGYVSKAEAPERKFGRRAVWGLSNFLFWWLDALGLRLVLMDRGDAEALVMTADGEPGAESHHRPYAARADRCGAAVREKLIYSFTG